MNKITDRIVLGTAQFGLDYGINNKKGKLSDEELSDVLRICVDSGIEYLDTAYSYGDSEERIGRFSKENDFNFNIITKLPDCDIDEVEKTVNKSLCRLNTCFVYGYLIHSIDILRKNPGIYYELCKLKEKGLIKKTGFSLYNESELETLFADKIEFDLLQVPYNIFDQRFETYFELLKEKNIEVHIRSVYLQGLFFISSEKLNSGFLSVKDKIKMLENISVKSGLPINVLCLSFVLKNSFIDKAVIGIDGSEQLSELLSSEQKINDAYKYYNELKSLKEDNTDIILPYKWSKK